MNGNTREGCIGIVFIGGQRDALIGAFKTIYRGFVEINGIKVVDDDIRSYMNCQLECGYSAKYKVGLHDLGHFQDEFLIEVGKETLVDGFLGVELARFRREAPENGIESSSADLFTNLVDLL
ncbi:hypothetical protein NE237_004808 [Protea cynaroides]|uniref:Uncharacterized protein n=1 Tax=Protea cynaroides TaxID=273540 RepID=A0A9Q0KK50_9MAGN|nr:hypothetical protein NE237_004808 [Protea cynaroides]